MCFSADTRAVPICRGQRTTLRIWFDFLPLSWLQEWSSGLARLHSLCLPVRRSSHWLLYFWGRALLTCPGSHLLLFWTRSNGQAYCVAMNDPPPSTPECWDYRHTPPWSAYNTLTFSVRTVKPAFRLVFVKLIQTRYIGEEKIQIAKMPV